MKPLSILFLISILTVTTANGAESTDGDILAQRGKGIVTQKAFSARADRIPSSIRRETLRNGNRLRDVINSLLLRAQLAEDAREAGFDKQEMVKERMRLAAEAELGEAWLQHYVETQPAADYEALARENYQLNQDTMLSTSKIDVSHILISAEQRSDTEAKEIAETVWQQLSTAPASFDDLVLQYSDDPSASSNQGRFKGVKKGDMVKPFEDTAFALAEGEISQPVKTRFGYHIIRLDAHIPASKMEFDEIKEQLMQAERKRHEGRIQKDYLESLTTQEVMMTQEALEEMVRRQFGEDYVDSPVDSAESE